MVALSALALGACASGADSSATTRPQASTAVAASSNTTPTPAVGGTTKTSALDSLPSSMPSSVPTEPMSDASAGTTSTVGVPTSPPSTQAPGDITKTVPAEPQPTLPVTPADHPVSVDPTVTVSIDSIDRVEATAKLPGEIAGPAVAVTATIRNLGTAPVELGSVTVTVADTEAMPLSPTTASPAAPFSGSVPAGASASATYVFGFPAERHNPITININYSAAAPIAVFSGTVPES